MVNLVKQPGYSYRSEMVRRTIRREAPVQQLMTWFRFTTAWRGLSMETTSLIQDSLNGAPNPSEPSAKVIASQQDDPASPREE